MSNLKYNANGDVVGLMELTGSLPTGTNTLGNVILAGRSATKTNIFNALAITNTANNTSTAAQYLKDSRNAILKINNSLNQPVSLAIFPQVALVTTKTFDSAGAVKPSSVTIPAETREFYITSQSLELLGFQYTDSFRFCLVCSVAPTAGSITVDLMTMPSM